MLAEMDTSGDGQVQFEEFFQHFRGKALPAGSFSPRQITLSPRTPKQRGTTVVATSAPTQPSNDHRLPPPSASNSNNTGNEVGLRHGPDSAVADAVTSDLLEEVDSLLLELESPKSQHQDKPA